MIRRQDIIEELTNRGYKAEEYTSIKNGVEFKGIHFMNEDDISPVIYTDSIIAESNTLLEAVKNVLNAYENSKIMDFNKENFLNPDFIMENLYIGLQKTGSENIVKLKTDFEGIEKYLYVRINDKNASFKLTGSLLAELKVDESKAWKAAEVNTFADTKIIPMNKMLSELLGQEIEESELLPQYIVTNTVKFGGASAIMDKNALKRLAKRLDTHKFIVLPSSIHEMIVIPDDGNGSMEEFNVMVKEVNQTQVAPEERLADCAYVIEV